MPRFLRTLAGPVWTCLGHALVPTRRAAVQKSDGILMAPQEAAGDDVGALESRLRQCRVLQVGPMVYVDSMWFLSCLFQKGGMPHAPCHSEQVGVLYSFELIMESLSKFTLIRHTECRHVCGLGPQCEALLGWHGVSVEDCRESCWGWEGPRDFHGELAGHLQYLNGRCFQGWAWREAILNNFRAEVDLIIKYRTWSYRYAQIVMHKQCTGISTDYIK